MKDNYNSKIKMTALIGYPLEHSLSSILHNELYRRLGVNAVMIAIPNKNIARLVKIIRNIPIHLTAVTIPHKQTIIPFLDKIDLIAKEIGAVNTVINKDGKLFGYNTDVIGVAQALKGVKIAKQKVLLVGAGGVAQTVAYYIKKNGGKLLCYNRTRKKASELATRFNGEIVVSLSQLKKNLPQVIINTTSVGMHPNTKESPIPSFLLHRNQTVFDLIYNPAETALMREAKSKGAKVVNGISMFIAQGLEQEHLWLGLNFSFEEYRKFLADKLYVNSINNYPIKK